jgi:uncharacterized protein with HEPN domain
MKNRSVSEFLQDILEAIQEIEAFTAGVDLACIIHEDSQRCGKRPLPLLKLLSTHK